MAVAAMRVILPHRAPGEIEGWYCQHQKPRPAIEDGEINLCQPCSAALRHGRGKLMNADRTSFFAGNIVDREFSRVATSHKK